MRKIGLVLAALCAFSVRTDAADSGTTVRAAGGLASPASGDFDEAFKSGPDLSLAVARDFGRYITVLGELEYARFPLDRGKLEDLIQELGGEEGRLFAQLGGQIDVTGGDTKFLSGAALVKGSLLGNDGSFTPYLIAGGGVTRRQTDAAELTLRILGFTETDQLEESSETAASVAFGAGLDLSLGSSAGLFVEGRYHIAFLEDDSVKYTTVRLGFSLTL